MDNESQNAGSGSNIDANTYARRLQIVSRIAYEKSISLDELARAFNVSTEIILSDIHEMQSLSIPLTVRGTHGTPRVAYTPSDHPPSVEVWIRRLLIIARIIRDRSVPTREFEQDFHVSTNVIRDDIRELQSSGIPVELSNSLAALPATTVEILWQGTPVGDRLQNENSVKVKRHLAAEVVRYICEQGGAITSLLLGTGVSCYTVAERLLASMRRAQVQEIFTSSLLVLFSHIYYRPSDVILKLAGGQMDRTTAWLEGDTGIEQLRCQAVDAVVTSFMCLSKRGFWTQQPYEVNEKLMNLQHAEARFVLIPIEWAKLAEEHGNLIAPDGRSGEDALDGRGGHRKYVIFTDVPAEPRGAKHAQRLAVLDHWASKPHVEIKRIAPCA